MVSHQFFFSWKVGYESSPLLLLQKHSCNVCHYHLQKSTPQQSLSNHTVIPDPTYLSSTSLCSILSKQSLQNHSFRLETFLKLTQLNWNQQRQQSQRVDVLSWRLWLHAIQNQSLFSFFLSIIWRITCHASNWKCFFIKKCQHFHKGKSWELSQVCIQHIFLL